MGEHSKGTNHKCLIRRQIQEKRIKIISRKQRNLSII